MSLSIFERTPPTPAFRRLMVFIDGGYLRKGLRDCFGTEDVDYGRLLRELTSLVSRAGDLIRGELIRAYYYDANVAESERDEFLKRDEYFKPIRNADFYEVRLGRLIPAKEGYRQKGVDVLLAIDMITKAYEDHYDIAIILAGDDDFVDIVKAVKDAGKRVFGAFFEPSASKRLLDSLDLRCPLDNILATCVRQPGQQTSLLGE